MSIIAIKDAFEIDLPPAEKLILICFCSYLDNSEYKQGKPALAWPSPDEVARKSGYSSRTVKSAIKNLKSIGRLSLEHKGGGRSNSSTYRINLAINSEPAAQITGVNGESTAPFPNLNSEAPSVNSEADAPILINQDIEQEVFCIPLKDGSEYRVSKLDIQSWVKAYPAMDIKQALAEIRQWNISNPNRRKTKTGINRHITAWLKKGQDNETRKSDTQDDIMVGAF